MSTEIVQQIFVNQLTKKGLADLKKKYPKKLKLDMTDDEVFKAARKTKTERNKLLESISRRRIDITSELKQEGDSLEGQVSAIYAVVINPFETEVTRRKEVAQKLAEERMVKLTAERAEIKAISGFYDAVVGKSTEEIASVIEAVDLIEVDIFDKELIHEAMEVKKTTLSKLDALMSDTKSREAVNAEREKLADEAANIARAAAITDRINTLKMIPTTMFGKSANDIFNKIANIKNYAVTEKDFDGKADEAKQAVITVVSQLEMMGSQQKMVEKAELSKCDPAPEYEVEQGDHSVDLERQDQTDKMTAQDSPNDEQSQFGLVPGKEVEEKTEETKRKINPFHNFYHATIINIVKDQGETGEDFKYRICQMAFNQGVEYVRGK